MKSNLNMDNLYSTDKECKIIQLPLDVLDTQNYIAASDIVITKAGWGTIGEAIIGHSSLVLIERPSAKEDTFNIEIIKKNSLGISIKEEDLANIDIQEIRNRLDNNINYDKLNNYRNNVKNVVNSIISTPGISRRSKILKLNPFYSEKIWGYEEWNLSTHKNGLSTLVDSQTTLIIIGKELPIMIKVIQANDKLSVQVHPDDEYSRMHENDNEKQNAGTY